MKNKAAQELGRLGGKATSEAKAKAAAENGKKGGRPRNCQCGEILGEACCADPMPRGDMIEIEHMPECLRGSHEAANNRGVYPHNGAIRLRVTPDCAEFVCDDDWTFRV